MFILARLTGRAKQTSYVNMVMVSLKNHQFLQMKHLNISLRDDYLWLDQRLYLMRKISLILENLPHTCAQRKTANASECGKNTKWGRRQVLFISTTFQFIGQEGHGVRKKRVRHSLHILIMLDPVGLACEVLGRASCVFGLVAGGNEFSRG